MSVTLKLKEIQTAVITVPISIPPDIDGFVKATVKVRSKAEMKKLGEDVEDGVYADDVAILRDLYVDIRGLGGEDGKPIEGDDVFTFLGGDTKLGAYLATAFIQAYFAQYGEALQKNSQKRRSR